MNQIKKPIFIMHQLDNGKAECLIFGAGAENPADEHKCMGLYIADLIGHVAKANGVSVSHVVDWINRELSAPTSKLLQTNVN